MTSKPRIGPMLRLVLGVGRILSPFARPVLKRRLAKGKEDPDRWLEKLGQASLPRPDGPLVWLHGVGVGEVMALRGLIESLAAARPDLQFLVTSSARSSGEVFANNLPAKTRHQYLPLDLPKPVAAFLDHWKPDLAVWSDQEIWPRLAVTSARRAIPQAYIAARITEKSAKAKARFGAAYGDLYRLLDLRHAQDEDTATHLRELMGDDSKVQVTGSLKAAAAALAFDPDVLASFDAINAKRRIWLLASSHEADELAALEAHHFIRNADPSALLIIAPRDIQRAGEIEHAAKWFNMPAKRRSLDAHPTAETAVYIADTFGELGTWYRLASAALIGGTFDSTEGHNPWEAVALECAVLHGSHTRNFQDDYVKLQQANASRLVTSPHEISRALADPNFSDQIARATAVRDQDAQGLGKITADLIDLLKV